MPDTSISSFFLSVIMTFLSLLEKQGESTTIFSKLLIQSKHIININFTIVIMMINTGCNCYLDCFYPWIPYSFRDMKRPDKGILQFSEYSHTWHNTTY